MVITCKDLEGNAPEGQWGWLCRAQAASAAMSWRAGPGQTVKDPRGSVKDTGVPSLGHREPLKHFAGKMDGVRADLCSFWQPE